MKRDEAMLIDARGHRCPVPSLRLRRALEAAPVGGRVELLADDPLARIDVPHLLREAGHVLVELDEVGRELRFLVEKRGNLANRVFPDGRDL